MKINLFFKTLTIFLFNTLVYQAVKGQINTFPSSGKVGIGTGTPGTQLEILAPAISGGEKLMKFRNASNPVTFYLNPQTGLNVIASPSGEFVSGFAVSPTQLHGILTKGFLW
jgi:hypothetical protein